MTKVTPDYPKLVMPKNKLMRQLIKPWLFLKSRNCSIAMITEGAYRMPLCEIRLPTRTTLFPLEPETVRRVLIEEWEQFPKSTMVSDVLELLMGDSIFVSNGDIWKRQRRMMDPAFEHARVKVVFDMMLDAAKAMNARLDRVADGRAVNVEEEMTFVTADIIFRTIFSRPLTVDEAGIIFKAFHVYQEAAFAHGLYRVIRLPRWATALNFRKAKSSARAIRNILDPIVKARYDSFHSGAPQTHNDILQSLVSVKDEVTGTHFDLRELCEQVSMLFLAGHETSASALSWGLHLLSLDQAVQQRMHDEARAVFGGRDITFADLRKLGITRNVFAETLRLFPPVPFLPREATKTCPFRNKTAEKGTIVSISPWMLQRHRAHWQNPDAFDPDRFDRPETREAERNCYIPFSKGPRVCLGASFALQEATIILSALASRYRFEPKPGFTPRVVGRLTLRSEAGIWLNVSRRPDPH